MKSLPESEGDSVGSRRLYSILALMLFAACKDDEVTQRFPIEAFLLQYNDPMIACSYARPTIRVGAFVGHYGCELESAGLVVREDSLFVAGVARCTFRRISSPTTPPAERYPQWVTISLPDLDPGEYTLCADDLCGQVTVTEDCNAAVVGKLYASGFLNRADSCVLFYTGMGFQILEARGIDSPLPVGEVRISGVPVCSMPWCPEICSPFLDGVVQVLSVDAGPLPAPAVP